MQHMNTVTISYLQMTHPEQLQAKACDDPLLTLREAKMKQWRVNAFFYRWIGADWHWQDRLPWSDEQWRSYAEGDNLRTFIASYDGSPAGYFELRASTDRDTDEDAIEIVMLGIAPAFIGKGFGSVLCSHALQVAWQSAPQRVWLHTCTEDHPSALPNYQARGMRVYKTEVENQRSRNSSSSD